VFDDLLLDHIDQSEDIQTGKLDPSYTIPSLFPINPGQPTQSRNPILLAGMDASAIKD